MDQPDDLHELEVALLAAIGSLATQPSPDDAAQADADTDILRAVYSAQVESRCVDHAARWLRASGKGFYTIGSAGHESNAAVAAALRPTDPALLHYRSGGFYCMRASQVTDFNPCSM